jgi:hypothetical protein
MFKRKPNLLYLLAEEQPFQIGRPMLTNFNKLYAFVNNKEPSITRRTFGKFQNYKISLIRSLGPRGYGQIKKTLIRRQQGSAKAKKLALLNFLQVCCL